ncbi:MAG: hypothetical protein VB055_10385 [Oscillospiraceae bacterium]|nr:hypothetical protein [Oscillospiraceae bacterium]
MNKKTIKLGIGFATGRKSFRKVLNSYIYSWNESGIRDKLQTNVSLSLFVAYDVDYSNTKSTDYTNLNQDIVDAFEEVVFLGAKNAQNSIRQLVGDGGLSDADAKLLFGAGYAGKRNAIVYAALEHNMDYILFLDDDEYPVSVTKTHDTCLWGGQYVLPEHLQNIEKADITNGHHCGYISPIPQIRFNDVLTELDFSRFIETISNDIVNWSSIKSIQQNGGITYADIPVLLSKEAVPVEEVNHCKFISGSNLCINLTKPERTFPFFNPPGARGEDTFLSTLLSDRVVTRIPCYTFHDGFSSYHHLLDGVLPLHLEPILPNSKAVVTRFYNACVGWIRYKPLLSYITAPDQYENTIAEMQLTLQDVLPKICLYFERAEFMNLTAELVKYSKAVPKHHRQFLETQKAWAALLKEKKYWHTY